MDSIPWIESPFFNEHFPADGTETELMKLARSMHDDGYVVIEFPDAELDERITAIQANLQDRYNWEEWCSNKDSGLRIQDAWEFDENVKAIACNSYILDLLSKLYGRAAFPFQTLNFPVGTQQHYHTDCVHFASIPERFMCGVWVAFEDISPDAGPLVYYPGSHKLPVYLNESTGIIPKSFELGAYATYDQYVSFWQRLVKAYDLQPVEFLPKKGQAIIWAANLLHGGLKQNNRELSRWSQVTHYFFENCGYYTPLGSLPYLGLIQYRSVINIATNQYIHNVVSGINLADNAYRFRNDYFWALLNIPEDFNEVVYLDLNPDVAAAKMGATDHYIRYGIFEGRRYI